MSDTFNVTKSAFGEVVTGMVGASLLLLVLKDRMSEEEIEISEELITVWSKAMDVIDTDLQASLIMDSFEDRFKEVFGNQ